MLLFALALTGCIVHDDCEETETTSDTGSVPTTRPDCVEDFALQVVDADTVIEAGCVTRILESVAIGSGATLTIEAGAWVEVARGATLWIGRDGRGRLVADGTEEAPVTLTAMDGPVRGGWGGVVLDDEPMPGTTLRHTVVEYAGEAVGGNGDEPGALMVMWPDDLAADHVVLDHVTFRHNAFGGINLFSDNFNGPPGALSMSGVVFEDNGGLSIRWYPDGIADIAPDTVADEPVVVALPNLFDTRPWVPPAPVVLEDGLRVDDGGELHLADADLLFARRTGLAETDGGVFLERVRLGSAAVTPMPGDWEGLSVNFPGGPLLLDGCIVEHADAGDYGVVSLWDSPETAIIEGTTFRDNIGHADIWGAEYECARFLGAGNTFDLVSCES